MILTVTVPGVLALLLAVVLLRRMRPWLAFGAGLGVILVAQIVLQVRLRLEVEACVERACRLITDAAACQAAAFGCHEWTGLAALAHLIGAAIDVVLLAAGCAIAAALLRRRRAAKAPG